MISCALCAFLWQGALAQHLEVPREWIDPDTGHRVIRLSDEPGSQSLYFHQNPYTPDGQKLIITTPTGLSAIDLKTRAIEKIVEGRVGVIIVGKRTGQVYYTRSVMNNNLGNNVRSTSVYATYLNTKATREIVKLPPATSVSTVNADETLLAGTIDEKLAAAIKDGTGAPPAPQAPRGDAYPGKGQMMENRLAERRPLQLITIDTKTGAVKTLLRGTDWYNHIQFSPTDPTLLLFCHEGPWHKVDRTWTIRTDGSQLTQIHRRTRISMRESAALVLRGINKAAALVASMLTKLRRPIFVVMDGLPRPPERIVADDFQVQR